MNNDVVVLAFSGGLDTSYCLLDLKQRGYQVHSVFVDTGGVDEQEKRYIEERANSLGADRHWTLDVADDLWDEFVVPLVWSGARMLGHYPLLCSDRYLIVRHCLALCARLGSRHFAHGCTGMGNDQLRFDQTVRSLGDYHIIAPIRELQSRTKHVRQFEIEALTKAGHQVRRDTGAYSINENILGVTISGSEIDRFEAPQGSAWKWTAERPDWPAQALQLAIGFKRGQAVSLDGQAVVGPELLRQLNLRCGQYGVGRHVYTGDVSIGLKGRIAFECPGIDALLCAHAALEDAVLTRLQNQFKSAIAQRWGELVYTGFFYEPHKADLEAYLLSSQRHVTGEVVLRCDGGVVYPITIDSPHILRDERSIYAQSCDWSPQEAEGFIKLLGQSSTLSARINGVTSCKR